MILTEFLPARPNRLWDWCRQLGVRHAICKCAPELTGLPPPWDFSALRRIQQQFADGGLVLHGLEGDPFDMSRIKLGLPGREEDLEHYRQMLRNMGKLGIPLLCYNFMAGIGWHRSQTGAETRGGARTSRFDLRDVPESLTAVGEVSREQMRENYGNFLSSVLPTAEEAGVKMGLHPDDPPIPRLRGISRILSNPEDIHYALSLSNSPSHGVTFCQANFELMGADIPTLVRQLCAERRMFFVHFRNIRGTADSFEETFHDDGEIDMPERIRLYHDSGFSGPIRIDHVPTLAGEENDNPGYAMLGRLFAIGYLKGILQTLRIPVE
ncbi:MAG: mannonate dehydratase [Kiritimatiellia bacterium]|nr:mannonate dehydratase [Kiritimatiellia bacterium]